MITIAVRLKRLGGSLIVQRVIIQRCFEWWCTNYFGKGKREFIKGDRQEKRERSKEFQRARKLFNNNRPDSVIYQLVAHLKYIFNQNGDQ